MYSRTYFAISPPVGVRNANAIIPSVCAVCVADSLRRYYLQTNNVQIK